jgi:hypothetical protein
VLVANALWQSQRAKWLVAEIQGRMLAHRGENVGYEGMAVGAHPLPTL